jgi:hypothetical protein
MHAMRPAEGRHTLIVKWRDSQRHVAGEYAASAERVARRRLQGDPGQAGSTRGR